MEESPSRGTSTEGEDRQGKDGMWDSSSVIMSKLQHSLKGGRGATDRLDVFTMLTKSDSPNTSALEISKKVLYEMEENSPRELVTCRREESKVLSGLNNNILSPVPEIEEKMGDTEVVDGEPDVLLFDEDELDEQSPREDTPMIGDLHDNVQPGFLEEEEENLHDLSQSPRPPKKGIGTRLKFRQKKYQMKPSKILKIYNLQHIMFHQLQTILKGCGEIDFINTKELNHGVMYVCFHTESTAEGMFNMLHRLELHGKLILCQYIYTDAQRMEEGLDNIVTKMKGSFLTSICEASAGDDEDWSGGNTPSESNSFEKEEIKNNLSSKVAEMEKEYNSLEDDAFYSEYKCKEKGNETYSQTLQMPLLPLDQQPPSNHTFPMNPYLHAAAIPWIQNETLGLTPSTMQQSGVSPGFIPPQFHSDYSDTCEIPEEREANNPRYLKPRPFIHHRIYNSVISPSSTRIGTENTENSEESLGGSGQIDLELFNSNSSGSHDMYDIFNQTQKVNSGYVRQLCLAPMSPPQGYGMGNKMQDLNGTHPCREGGQAIHQATRSMGSCDLQSVMVGIGHPGPNTISPNRAGPYYIPNIYHSHHQYNTPNPEIYNQGEREKYDMGYGMGGHLIYTLPHTDSTSKLDTKLDGSILNAKRKQRRRNIETIEDKVKYLINLHEVLLRRDVRTTLMIRNIPNKYNQKMILNKINENHRNKYDFFYLPIDFKNRCNVGYAFINFVEPLFVLKFFEEFNGKKWEKFNSEKICQLTFGRIQGKYALIEHFKSSSVMNQEDKKVRPMILNVGPPPQNSIVQYQKKLMIMYENKLQYLQNPYDTSSSMPNAPQSPMLINRGMQIQE